MKKLSACVIIILLGFLSSGSADSVKHVDLETFLNYAEFIECPTSVSSAEFIGTTHDRAYLEYATVITLPHILHLKKEPTYIIYWIELEALPKDALNKIKKNASFRELKNQKNQNPTLPIDLSK